MGPDSLRMCHNDMCCPRVLETTWWCPSSKGKYGTDSKHSDINGSLSIDWSVLWNRPFVKNCCIVIPLASIFIALRTSMLDIPIMSKIFWNIALWTSTFPLPVECSYYLSFPLACSQSAKKSQRKRKFHKNRSTLGLSAAQSKKGGGRGEIKEGNLLLSSPTTGRKPIVCKWRLIHQAPGSSTCWILQLDSLELFHQATQKEMLSFFLQTVLTEKQAFL